MWLLQVIKTVLRFKLLKSCFFLTYPHQFVGKYRVKGWFLTYLGPIFNKPLSYFGQKGYSDTAPYSNEPTAHGKN